MPLKKLSPNTQRSLDDQQATATISRRGAARLHDGHVWVYRSDVTSPPVAAPLSLTRVVDERGKFLGTALYSSASQIAL
ncbi:MAG: SAM-dependent methyltransferase, partial [Acidobacteriales bacterium]|nr:SAM-dependent methyltransferase [Terriglobales bacterium]